MKFRFQTGLVKVKLILAVGALQEVQQFPQFYKFPNPNDQMLLCSLPYSFQPARRMEQNHSSNFIKMLCLVSANVNIR